jgi:hypothetical protein
MNVEGVDVIGCGLDSADTGEGPVGAVRVSTTNLSIP